MAGRRPTEDRRCIAVIEATGERCQSWTLTGRDVCHGHDPDRAPRTVMPDDDHRCQARSKKRIERGEADPRCPNWVELDAKVCKYHGGRAVQVREASEVRALQRKARAEKTYGTKAKTTPVEALLEEVQWTAGHVAWLRRKVRRLEAAQIAAAFDDDTDVPQAGEQNALVWGVTRRKTGGDDHGVTEEAAPNIYLKLYQAERSHLVRACADAIRAGLDERVVRIAERQGEIVAEAIRAILRDLNLSPQQQALVAQVVPLHLRRLAG